MRKIEYMSTAFYFNEYKKYKIVYISSVSFIFFLTIKWILWMRQFQKIIMLNNLFMQNDRWKVDPMSNWHMGSI